MSGKDDDVREIIAPKGREAITGHPSPDGDGVVPSQDGHKRPPGAGGLEDQVEQIMGGHGQRYNIAKELGEMPTDPSSFLPRGAMSEEQVNLIGLIIEQDEWVDGGHVDVHRMGYRRYASSVSIEGLAREQMTSIGVAEEKTASRMKGNMWDRLNPFSGNKNGQEQG